MEDGTQTQNGLPFLHAGKQKPMPQRNGSSWRLSNRNSERFGMPMLVGGVGTGAGAGKLPRKSGDEKRSIGRPRWQRVRIPVRSTGIGRMWCYKN
ncbi:hypothetical protein PILCRDRAFT_826786 [Piloderma croceum F 1598]|uniref:Uncharacterized protein n=1 Tax=Piloderma croceum (strain F 1598) TaxID=765440 RepID=A0A0C3F7Q0_PILCF|nr:hypothetical protein PILCRDRAFT_826786 [Piloderma croceum F 1598]